MALDEQALETLDANFAIGIAAVEGDNDPELLDEIAEYFELRCQKYVDGMRVTDWRSVAAHAAAFAVFDVSD